MRVGLILVSGFVLVAGTAVGLYSTGIVPAVDVARFVPASLSRTPAPPPTPAAIPVTITSARVEDVPIYLSAIGTVQAYNMVSVKTRVDGQITQILFQEGQDVKTGDLLALIDPRPFEAQLQQQRAARQRDQALFEGAQSDLKRFENLVTRDFATKQSVDQQRAQVGQYRAQILSDEAQIQYAETQLSYTRIVAPIDGRVGIRQIDLGNYVHAADTIPMVVISQLKPISVVFTVSATALAQYKVTLGQTKLPVVALAANDTTVLDRGFVELIDNQVDQATGTIKVKATFPNEALRLWPGNFVSGRLIVDTKKGGLTVPSAAVRHGPRGDFAWIVKPDNTAQAKQVTVGQIFGGRTLVESGLAHDDRIVIDGYFRLDNNVHVEIVKTEPATPPARPAATP